MKLPITTILVFLLFCTAVPVLSLNPSPLIPASGMMVYPSDPPPPPTDVDYTVLKDGTVFKAINSETGATFSHEDSWVTINYAINAISSGTVYVQSGTYPIGMDTVIAEDASWVSASSSITIDNNAAGQEGASTQINIPYPAPTGLIAYYNFPSPVDLSDDFTVNFWFRPSTDLSNRQQTYDWGGSPLRLLLDDSPNCASPSYTRELFHPEWITAEWKYLRVPGGPGSGLSLPTGSTLRNVRSIGIEVFSNPQCITPSSSYNVRIDDIHTCVRAYVTTKSNVKLIGAGANTTILHLSDHSNIPMMYFQGSNVEVAGLQLDGNIDNQDAIDECMGIYNSGGDLSGSSIHHCYIHHTKGDGIKIRGSNIEIYENLIEWIENANIALTYTPSYIYIHHNTLRYAINDDNVWIKEGHHITIEYNEIRGVTSALLHSGDPNVPEAWRNRNPSEWNGIRVQQTHDNVVQYNKFYDTPAASLVTCGDDYDSIFQYNQIYRANSYSGNALRVMTWEGSATRIQVIGNLVVDGHNRGIEVTGTQNVISDSWTRGNNGGGIFISGSGHTGSGNYAEETNNNAPGSFMSSTPPSLPTFQAGITW